MSTILIAEEDDDVRHMVVNMFTSLDYETIPAASLARAKRLYDVNHPDAVITSLGGLSMHGVELARYLRRADQNLPVILFSGIAGALREAEKALFTDILRKPEDLSKLAKAVENALPKKPGAARASSPSDVPTQG